MPIEITQPLMLLQCDGVTLSEHALVEEAMSAASHRGPGEYTLVRPDGVITVAADDAEPADPGDPVDPGQGDDGDGPEFGERGQYRNPLPVGPYCSGSSRLPSFEYLGAVEVKGGDYGCSSTYGFKGAFCVRGTDLWLTGKRGGPISAGLWSIPDLSPDTVVRAELVTPFFAVEPEPRAGTGDHMSGIYYDADTDYLIVTITEYYDANKDNHQFIARVRPDGSDADGWYDVTNGQMAAGQVLRTPDHLVDQVGGRLYMHPEHWTNIITRVCNGAGLHGWDGLFPGDSRNIQLTPHLHYQYDQTLGEHGVQDGDDTAPANPIFNRLARYEVSFFWNESYISIGLNAGQLGGINYGIPPYGGSKGNYPRIEGDYDNYYWIWDQGDIFSAEDPWSPTPVEWGVLDIPGQSQIHGAYFDEQTATLWLSTGSQQPVFRAYRVS